MIYIAGMEAGSGNGEAASRKAGWLGPRAWLGDALSRVAAAAPRLPERRPAQAAPPPRDNRPAPSAIGADGRPLPPDGSIPPARPRTSAGDAQPARPVSARAPQSTAATPARRVRQEFGPDGRPLPPDGSQPPPRPAEARAAPGQRGAATVPPASSAPAQPAQPLAPAARAPGAPLTVGVSPVAPPGHSFVSRPAPAPPGEFLFDVRCSCGVGMLAPVKLDDLRRAAAQGLSPAVAIATATQDALDAMHRGE